MLKLFKNFLCTVRENKTRARQLEGGRSHYAAETGQANNYAPPTMRTNYPKERRDARCGLWKHQYSDVIDVIATDPNFKGSTMYNGGGEIPQRSTSYVKIIEQPASKAQRFRYECEDRCGAIPGASSTSTRKNKTFPSIQVVGYEGRAVVVVSCVTKNAPYKPHPHNLVGRDGCKKGVCTMEISPESMSVTFPNLRIQCVKKKDIKSSLKLREEIKVDPFRTGFGHRDQPHSIDLNAVRLCFQVFLEEETTGKFTVPLTPIVSEPIYDKKARSDLLIVKLSHCNSYVDGGRDEIILLCEKVVKKDIQVRFFEEKNGEVVWEGFGDFQPSQVHKQTAICFKAPPYHTLDINEPVKVFIQLWRPSDGASSEALPFEFLPLDSEPGKLKRKRQKYHDATQLLRHVEENEKRNHQTWNIPLENKIIDTLDGLDKARLPYDGQMFTTLRPAHNAPSMSSHYMGSTSAPGESLFTQNAAPLGDILDWNIPSTSLPNPISINFVNLDSNQMQFKPIDLNSGDLSLLEINNLSETFTHNLSLTDIGRDDQNMTDSLTRLANSTIDMICQ